MLIRTLLRPAAPFLAVAVLVAALPTSAAASSPSPRAKCSIKGQQSSLGPSYVTSLTVTGGVNCATGKRVVRAYDKCRKQNGGAKGKCRKKVLGYSCTEKRRSSSYQFSATATCKSGKKRVVFTYTQNT